MLSDHLLADLQARGLLPAEQAAAIRHDEQTRPFSLHQELRAALYLGVTLLTGGLGVLLYQHLDALGFGVVLAGTTLLMLASFAYVVWRRQPFTWGQAKAVSFVPDYVLLLGCLLFLALETFVLALFNSADTRYGLATVVPAVLFFGLAYRFDHRGVLTMGITALASWVGVSVAPLAAFDNAHHLARLGGAAVLLGLLLVGVGLYSDLADRKRHFAFTYISLGANLALLASTAVLFEYYSQPFLPKVVAVLLGLALSAGLIWYARRTHSYLFLLMGVLYGYVIVTYLVLNFLIGSHTSDDEVVLILLYFIFSAVGAVLLFMNGKAFLRRA
ncbi:DUF2157 domain-containing protein [Hymenobacter weizhouensis]|uniref:DUF2157 domain-containing protein n=1 Tax=Hymenobacter sp. YIM 151500-1 TaxID=2987689 RepID=UPI002226667B|nr:DUF2157 domain-containing protein [Hymenobacter sp. YIM 151500-1]UYZ61829.1 DUF2157 domain-containing protein [Hymenobacter sp. YIM 151500-1]